MITVISCWYNEEFLAPFFMNHYKFADKILILMDDSTTDRSYDIACNYNNVEFAYLKYPQGMDEKIKVRYINETYAMIDSGYVLNVDADEFVFCNKDDFVNCKWQVSHVELINVYRHKDDAGLDSRLPVMEQRRHGAYRWPYKKPVVARAGMNLQWTVGNHSIKVNGKREKYYDYSLDSQVDYRQQAFKGVHWANADPCFCVKRRLERRDRQSPLNMTKKYSLHNHGINEYDILAECKLHENDPIII